MNPHPLACPLVVHVGVTGHRALPVEAVPVIRKTMTAVVATVDSAVRGIAAAEADTLPEAEPVLLRLISSLAEGADQLAAEVALEHGWEVQCPLPFPREEYVKDFSGEAAARYAALLARATSVFEHAGSRQHEGAAYLEAGRTMLAQSDLLVAVWNGQPSQGTGGTAEIVREALAKGMPVVRIDPAQPKMPVLLGTAARNADWATGVQAYLDDLLSLKQHKGLGRLRTYLCAVQDLRNYAWVHQFFRSVFSGERWSIKQPRREPYSRATEKWAAQWRTELASLSEVGERIDGGVGEHYAWANGLAETNAGIFRSAYILRYFLVTLAVLWGAIGFYAPISWGWKGFVAQVLCLLVAIWLILRDNGRGWQRKGIEYRWLAEQLRIHRYLLPLGRTMLPVTQHGHPIYEGPRWARRQVRCIVRRIGLVQCRVDAAYLRVHRAIVLEHEIAGLGGQWRYHNKNAKRNRRIADRLRRWAMRFFAVGFVAIAVRMGLWAWAPTWSEMDLIDTLWVLEKAAAATLPALGVMFSSMGSHGEFKRLAARSRAMAKYLCARAVAFRANDAPTWAEAVDDTTQLAQILRAEVADWSTVMEGRKLALPV